ncbi:MAG: hypothetical protein K6U00_00980, partial [Armatimonadetes bacterium]|nr:hypothetical protein [Armatimonadota bacterium]
RLMLPMDHVPPYGSPYDYLAIRDADIPRTDDYLVAEVSPLAPQGLRRAESRIYILGSGERLSATQNTVLENPACKVRRLTTLGDQTCELAPLCSPSGKWIAFTMVNFKDRYVAPAVCHSDGSGYQELIPAPVDNGRFYDFRCVGRGWVPTGPLDVTKVERRGGSSALYMWAQPHLFPIEWSEDGTYLLLGKDGRFGELLVARYKDDKWAVILVSMAGAGALGDVLRPFAAFGPCSDGVCRVIEGPAMLLTEVTETGKVEHRPISVPKEIVRWVDW